MYRTSVVVPVTQPQSIALPSIPRENVVSRICDATRRSVSEIPAAAAAPRAALIPGTISYSIPPLRRASIASPARPKIDRPPPFSRTTGGRRRQGKQPLFDGLVRRGRRPCGGRFRRLPVRLIESQELSNDRGNGPCGLRHDLAPRAHAVGILFAAQQELVIRSLLITNLPDVAVETDIGNVMMPAGIGAAADFDV